MLNSSSAVGFGWDSGSGSGSDASSGSRGMAMLVVIRFQCGVTSGSESESKAEACLWPETWTELRLNGLGLGPAAGDAVRMLRSTTEVSAVWRDGGRLGGLVLV